MWPYEATVTSQQLTFYLEDHSSSANAFGNTQEIKVSAVARVGSSHVMTRVVHVERKSQRLKIICARQWCSFHVCLLPLHIFFIAFIVLFCALCKMVSLKRITSFQRYVGLSCPVSSSRWQQWTAFNAMVLESKQESDPKQRAVHN